MAVLFGSLLTVANVGDSKAFLDTGSELVELTTSHRIEDNVGACSASYLALLDQCHPCIFWIWFLLSHLSGMNMQAFSLLQGPVIHRTQQVPYYQP